MGFMDLFRSKMVPQAGATVDGKFGINPNMNQAMAPTLPDPGPMQTAPQMVEQPGFFARQRIPGADGISNADRILMGLMSLNGDTQGAVQYGGNLKKTAKDDADRAHKNAALKAAYANGKFDPAAYMKALGNSGDAADALSIAKELAPKAGVDDGFTYTIDPVTGEVRWGGQRAASHAEESTAARAAAQQAHEQALEAIALGRLDVERQNARTNSFRAHKPGGHSSAPSWMPPGANVVHVPGS